MDYRQILINAKLLTAAYNGNVEGVEEAISEGADVNDKTDNGVALTIALLEMMDTVTGDEKIRYSDILYIITNEFSWKVNQTTVHPNRRTYVSIMEYAMIRKRYAWVEFFLKEGANPNLAMDSPYYRDTSDEIKEIIEEYSRVREKMGTPRRSTHTYLNFSNLRL